MPCGNCGAELLPGKPFCHACGTPAPTTCPQCGHAIAPGFRFCPDCGATINVAPAAPAPPATPANERMARLAAQVPREVAERMLAVGGAMAGERKRVTVLFCDLVGSTAIAEKLDPELYHDLLENYLALAFREIYHLDGFVNQLAGDGLMAIFGAPIPHEDAPSRAIRAALAISEALAAFNIQRRSEGEPELSIRIGINTGPVLVGAIGNDLKMDYSAIGDTTNVAARLQSLAAPGTILMSEDTYRLVRGFFAVREAGRFDVKGKSEPLVAYELIGLSEETTPMGVAEARGLTPFVGRDEELAQLIGCYERLPGRLSQVVSIVGEAGSGKSRLLYEFKQRLAEREVVILEGRCSSLTQMQAYGPWNSMMRLYFGITSRDSPEIVSTKVADSLRRINPDLLRIHPFLCGMLGLVPQKGDEQASDEVRRQTFTSMSDLFVALTFIAPTILMIEDLHWIDDASREMIELAVNRIERGRFMVLVSHRPEFQPAWRTHAALTQIFMRHLPDANVDEIARAIVRGPLPEELASLIRLKAEGNPFFAEEIARIVIEEGYVVCKDHRLELTRPVSELRMPGTVEEVLGARLDRLGAHPKRVTQVAAVLGRQFRKAQLLPLLDGEGIEVATQLEELVERGILHRKSVLSDDEYRFGESLTQEVAYESLLLKERRQLHARVAEMLEAEVDMPLAERSVLLAHHLGRSSDHQGAVRALLHAAREAEHVPSYPTAMKLYRQAWQTVSDVLGDAKDQSLARLAVESVYGLMRMHIVYATSDDPESEQAAIRGAEIAESLGNTEMVASLTTYRGFLVMSGERTRFHEGLALVESGIGIAQRAGLEQAALGIARGLGLAYIYDGRFSEAMRTVEQVLRGFEAAGDTAESDLYLGTHFIASMTYLWSDEYARAEKETNETYNRGRERSNLTIMSGTGGLLAWLHHMRGDAAAAKHWADDSLPIAETIGNVASVRTSAAVALASRLSLGEQVSPGHYIDGMEQNYLARGDMACKSALVVDTLIRIGEAKRAKRFAMVAYANAGGRYRECIATLGLAEALRAVGEDYWGEARRFYQTSISIAEAIGSRSTLAAASLGAGVLAMAEGRDGESLIRRCLDLSREIGLGLYTEKAERALAEEPGSRSLTPPPAPADPPAP